MSSKTTVRVTEDADGRVRAVDTESGATGEGESLPEALVELARKIAAIQEDVAAIGEMMDSIDRPISDLNPSPNSGEFEELARGVRERFEEEGVTEEDVDEAIEWARSE